MADLYLVRHAQASLGSEDYDRLSELGRQQARWLGDYFVERGIAFDRVVTGSMQRQVETGQLITEQMSISQEPAVHDGFNECDCMTILKAYQAENPASGPIDWQDTRQMVNRLRRAIKAWTDGRLPDACKLETWQEFHRRVSSALDFARRPGGRSVLVVSSGVAISVAISQILGVGNESLLDLAMQAKNTGVSHFYYNEHKTSLSSFNGIPHLDLPDRMSAITYA